MAPSLNPRELSVLDFVQVFLAVYAFHGFRLSCSIKLRATIRENCFHKCCKWAMMIVRRLGVTGPSTSIIDSSGGEG